MRHQIEKLFSGLMIEKVNSLDELEVIANNITFENSEYVIKYFEINMSNLLSHLELIFKSNYKSYFSILVFKLFLILETKNDWKVVNVLLKLKNHDYLESKYFILDFDLKEKKDSLSKFI
jgi:hypothetical protein